MNIQFEKAELKHIDTIFEWLRQPHMMEFWDNTQEHKDDIMNFIHGEKQHYFYGTTKYWIGSIEGELYCFLLSDILQKDQELSDVHREHMSKSGHTIGLDFGIGNTKFLGRGLAAQTLEAFMSFYCEFVDPLVDTFFIDPDPNNPRAVRVYSKAGFEKVGTYEANAGAFIGQASDLMVKRV